MITKFDPVKLIRFSYIVNNTEPSAIPVSSGCVHVFVQMKSVILILTLQLIGYVLCGEYPIVINTWAFTSATSKGTVSVSCFSFVLYFG